MNNVEFTIVAHVRPDGSVPFQEALFIFGGDSSTLKAAVEAGLIRLQFGRNHGLPLTKHLENNLCYMRIKKTRVFFIFLKDAKIVLLNGFIKDQRKLPAGEIEFAKVLRKEAMA